MDHLHCETDSHIGITSNPNDLADEEFIIYPNNGEPVHIGIAEASPR